jgi:hypothetical protein
MLFYLLRTKPRYPGPPVTPLAIILSILRIPVNLIPVYAIGPPVTIGQ